MCFVGIAEKRFKQDQDFVHIVVINKVHQKILRPNPQILKVNHNQKKKYTTEEKAN